AIPFGTNLPSMRLQHESACAAVQCAGITLAPGATAAWTFFGLYSGDHPAASADDDLEPIDPAVAATAVKRPTAVELSMPAPSVLQDAPVAVADALDEGAIRQRYPR